MTLAELRVLVRNMLKYELEDESFTDADLQPYIQEAVRQFARDAFWRYTYTSANITAGTVEVDCASSTLFNPRLLVVSQVSWNGRQLEPVTSGERWLYLPATGTPSLAQIQGTLVRLYPVPSENGVLVAYGIRMPNMPSAAGDVIDVPAGYEHAIVCHTVYDLAKLKGKDNMPHVQARWAEYLHHVQRYREATATQRLVQLPAPCPSPLAPRGRR